MKEKKGFASDLAPENDFGAALQFISEPHPEPRPTPIKAKAPAGYRLNPKFIEKKTKRVQLVLRPSLYEKTAAAAKEQGVSLNEFVHALLEKTLEE